MSEPDPTNLPAVPAPATPPVAPIAPADPTQAPPAWTPAPPPPVARKTGTWQIVVGIVVLALSLGSWPRGVLGIVLSIARPNGVSPSYYAGVTLFGLLLVAVGVVLLIVGARIRKANRTA